MVQKAETSRALGVSETTVEKLGLDVSPSTMWRLLTSLNFTWKITRPVYSRKNDIDVKEERVSYVNWYEIILVNSRNRNLIFIGENPFDLHMIPSHLYEKKGETQNPVLAASKGPNVTVMLAVNGLNIVISEAIMRGEVNAETFKTFIFTLIMDDVPFHRSVRDIVPDDYPFDIKYLPKYSPFLNPCEEVFSQIKYGVRRCRNVEGAGDLSQRMRASCSLVTGKICPIMSGTANPFSNNIYLEMT
ncbi:hypothetical protein RF11_02597 [Thelohanellus kitauei]|uniref:Tc1-like transposase DDE domain-containing protein n=1 Tax=Thelohanellus kitauei TaxID=669202 RepID=A0A0C2MIR6_THEKT|nr:hypothetical protein RF11_02597 [Thelohanellus kitauei]